PTRGARSAGPAWRRAAAWPPMTCPRRAWNSLSRGILSTATSGAKRRRGPSEGVAIGRRLRYYCPGTKQPGAAKRHDTYYVGHRGGLRRRDDGRPQGEELAVPGPAPRAAGPTLPLLRRPLRAQGQDAVADGARVPRVHD